MIQTEMANITSCVDQGLESSPLELSTTWMTMRSIALLALDTPKLPAASPSNEQAMNIKQAIQEIALSVENGTANPAETYALLYGISKTVDDCMAMIKESAIAEVSKHGKEGVSHFGLHLSTKGAGGRWNYKSVEIHNELSKKIKMVEELAQTAYRTGGGIADPDGQVIQAAVYLPGGDTIVCTKAK